MVDTTSLSRLFGVTGNSIFITNEFTGSYDALASPPVLIQRDSTFYYEKKIEQSIDKLSLRLNVFILDGLQLYRYDETAKSKELNYKKITQVRLDLQSLNK